MNIIENSIINKYGYIIPIDVLDKELKEKIIEELTMTPNVNKKYNKNIVSFKIVYYNSNKTKLILPRYYGIEKFGCPDDKNIIFNSVLNLDNISNISFKGELRDYQVKIIDDIKHIYFTNDSLKTFGSCIISIPPGKGKTVIALKLISMLKLRTLIVVHKTFLLNQWKERINDYIDSCNIGIIQQNKIDINNKQIVIAMLQSIISKDYDKELLSAFQLIVYDECHHLGAKCFSKSLIKLTAPFYLGLSATPSRKDKLDLIFRYFLGDLRTYNFLETTHKNILCNIFYYKSSHEYFKTIKNNYLGTYNNPTMITNLCKIEHRNKYIFDIINRILDSEPSRKILILTGRCNKSNNSINHVQILSDLINTRFPDDWGYYIGGMKEIQLYISSTKKIIIGTYEMAQEGLDIPTLDTLILATPLKGNIIQTCGRIMRGYTDNNPLIVDIVDLLEPFSFSGKARNNYYLKSSYDCNYFTINSDDEIVSVENSLLIKN